jgi:hypothetical protein
MSNYSHIRGVRNHNPGNLKFNGHVQWSGQILQGRKDNTFCEFQSAEMGIRAMARLLMTYHRRGLNSIAKIIPTYAPKSENDTENYIKYVEKNSGFNRHQPVNMTDVRQAKPIIKAMIHMECGLCLWDDATIERAIHSAKANYDATYKNNNHRPRP